MGTNKLEGQYYKKNYPASNARRHLKHHKGSIDAETRNHIDDWNIYLAISNLDKHHDMTHKVSAIQRPRPVSQNCYSIMEILTKLSKISKTLYIIKMIQMAKLNVLLKNIKDFANVSTKV